MKPGLLGQSWQAQSLQPSHRKKRDEEESEQGTESLFIRSPESPKHLDAEPGGLGIAGGRVMGGGGLNRLRFRLVW